MKAIRIAQPGGLENLQLVDLPDPGAPGPGEIRVRIRASSLNYHDYSVVNGNIPTADGRIPMSDGAGVVDAVGAGVLEFKAGDSVVSTFFPDWLAGPARTDNFARTPGDGVDGYAREWVVRPATWFTLAPQGFTHAEAATITTAGLTAWRALVVEGGLKAGDTVLTLGTGGVSIYALQIARAMGARVIATSSSDEKIGRLRELGAEHTINYRTEPEWGRRVKALTDGRGVDHVVEVGGPATLPQSLDAVRVGGHIALMGVLTGLAGEIPTVTLMRKQVRLQGIIVGSRAHQQDMVRGLEACKLSPVIDSRFEFADMADAFRHEAAGLHVGKICLDL